MNPDQFWSSQDGQILSIRSKDDRTVSLTLAFWPRNPAEFAFMKEQLGNFKFTERSSLARIGIEMQVQGQQVVDGHRLALEADAFIYDTSFPNAPYWKKLLRPGTPAGRLFFAPAAAKLSTQDIWTAIKENRIKLPNTISIDDRGRVFLTPHQVSYTLNPKLQRVNFELVVGGDAARNFLDKVQIRHDSAPLVVPPRSGVLTSCSMYLREHYVVLNQGEGNFGIHTGAVLLDPIKTFGTNIMLEIYNTGDQPVVNPLVSLEIFRAPAFTDPEFKTLAKRRQRLLGTAKEAFTTLDQTQAREMPEVQPKMRIAVRGQSASMENRSICIKASDDLKGLAAGLAGAGEAPRGSPPGFCGYRTMFQALEAAPENADTLLVDFFPDLLEHTELVTRLGDLRLKRIVFRKASRTHGYFLSSNSHARLDTFEAIGLQCYWYDEVTNDLYVHVYKRTTAFSSGRRLRASSRKPRSSHSTVPPSASTRRTRTASPDSSKS